MVLYLFFVLWSGCSIMETSLQTDIPYYICYRFVRTVMERIALRLNVYGLGAGEVDIVP
jgi:hypothetical protein